MRTLQGLERLGVSISNGPDGFHVLGREASWRKRRYFRGQFGNLHEVSDRRWLLLKMDAPFWTERADEGAAMEELLNGLIALGVNAYSKEKNGSPPIVVESRGLKGGKTRIKGEESSQFLSALLMIAPYAHEDVGVEIAGHLASKPYVDITLHVMSAFGVEVENNGYRSFFVRAGQRYLPRSTVLKEMRQMPPISLRLQPLPREG